MVINCNAIVPLSKLTIDSRKILSRLDTKKLLLANGPHNISLHRDWRGLAHLANIPSELAVLLNECHEKTDMILEIWEKFDFESAMVRRLFDYLQILDRYDVYDDLLALAKDHKLIVNFNW